MLVNLTRKSKDKNLSKKIKIKYLNLKKINFLYIDFDLIINCTTLGFEKNLSRTPWSRKYLSLYKNKPIIYDCWYYDQNSHQNILFNRVFEVLNKNKNYIFHSININSNQKKWRESLNYIKKDNSIKHYITNDFHTMSKKMILNNLNKIIITDNKGNIISISNIIELDSNLN